MKKEQLPKLHYACSDCDLRPIFNHVLVTKQHIVATDAMILVVIDTNQLFTDTFISEMPERFLIHSKNWMELCKSHIHLIFENNHIIQIHSGYTRTFPIVKEKDDLKYPDYNAVFPTEQKELKQIGVNFDRIEQLKKSMFLNLDIKNVKLEFYGDNQAIVVKSINFEGRKGLIMPVLVTD